MPNEANDGAWFAPKRLGYGAGLPIAWQGWLLLGGHVAVILGGTWLFQRRLEMARARRRVNLCPRSCLAAGRGPQTHGFLTGRC